MRKSFFLLIFVFAFSNAFSQNQIPKNPYQPILGVDWVQQKNYFLLSLLQQDQPVSQLLRKDKALSDLQRKKMGGLKQSLADCKDPACFTERMKLSDQEIKTAGTELKRLCKPGSALEKLVIRLLIPSMTYSLYDKLAPSEVLVKAWEQDAAGINYTIGVYAQGKKPNYPLIDSSSFNVTSKQFSILTFDVNTTLLSELKSDVLFFEPSMRTALLYLQLNERQDPANYEPMRLGVNKACAEHIKEVNWSKYPYSLILIPGAGLDNPNSPLSAEGMLRCRMAVAEYHAGKAPFLMPSGGKVHPYKTKYCEAEEMKTYLINVLHIPESAIIMEPHARHTTTNMRNGVRLIFRYGIPTNKPALVITDKSQTNGILKMGPRCEKELHYIPYKLGKKLSDTELEFYPLPQAFQINAFEPLDP